MKLFSILIFLLFFNSCIPLRVAPSIKEEKVMVAKKFKRSLPKSYSYIFKDPKDANEFYNYINTIYELNHNEVEFNVPVIIENNQYFLSFHEVEIPTKTINLVPMVIDAKLESSGNSPLLEDKHFSRIGNWYIVLTISDSKMKDSLNPEFANRQEVLSFLKELRLEYLNTSNYLDVLFIK